ncbi:hypothetical protein JCM19232_4730 [Vibrio ishigakensis]|uniref:Uncharacterized protein n=1 Tax=Vibrio ishigakensis TaxID=1481914 RepID=A0A0B8PJ14_9VIBR|nr:hypothetical protein JCM19232_4730 [Vibrio ishigakensis]
MRYTKEAVSKFASVEKNLRTLAIITDLIEGKTTYSIGKKYGITHQGAQHIKKKYNI